MGLIKLVIAIVVILVAASLVLTMFPGAGDKVKNVLGSTPLGGSATSPPQSSAGEGFDMRIYPSTQYSFKSDTPVDVTTENGGIKKFSGAVDVSFKNKTVVLTNEGTDLKVDYPLKTIAMTGVGLGKFSVSNSKIDVFSGNWRTQTENGTLEIEGFVGGVLIEADHIRFIGNVSSLRREGFS
ncbi:MAG TPA: hypothetical protein VJA47_01840 [archaeon]|nr:hypothetical protein [archaeon]